MIAAQATMQLPETGRPAEKELKGGEVHSYTASLPANHFLFLVANQKGIDAVVTMVSSDGRKLMEIDSPNGSNGPEPLWFVSESAGEFTVQISSLNKDAKPGKYEILVNEMRPATQDDRYVVAASNIAMEGVNVASTRTPDADVKAGEKFAEAERLYRLIDRDLAAKASGFLRMARIYRTRNQNDLALRLFDDAADIYEKLGSKAERAKSVAESTSVSPSEADKLRRNNTVHSIAKELGDRKLEVSSLIDIAVSHAYLGDFSRSIELNKTALALAQEIGFTSRIGRIYDNIGSVYTFQNDLAKALESHLKALEIYRANGETRQIAGATLNVGNVYLGLGNYQLALEAFQKSLTDFEAMKAPVGIAYAISNIGSTYLDMGEHEKALEYFLRAQPMKAKFLPEDPTSFYNIAAVYRAAGRFPEAIEYSAKALELCKKIESKDCSARTLIELSNTQRLHGDLAKALENAEAALAISKEFDYMDYEWQALLSLADVKLALGRKTEVRPALESAISVIEELRSMAIVNEDGGQNFLNNKRLPYQMLIDLAVSEGRKSEALELAERTKARILIDTMQSGRPDISKSVTRAEKDAELRLKSDLVSLQRQIDVSEEKKHNELYIELRKKRLELEDFKIRLYASHPDLRVRRGEMKPIALKETIPLLDASSALLEYVVTEDKTYLFVITKVASAPRLKVYPINIDRKLLSVKTAGYRSALASGDLNFGTSSEELYALLLKPASAQLAGKTNLVIVPDGSLWDLPFQALRTSASKYLIDSAAISYAPSLTALNEMRSKSRTRRPERTLLAFGNPVIGKQTSASVKRVFMSEKLEPLPEAERLVNSLKAMYGPEKSKVFTGIDAREGTAKSEAAKYGIVQFAAHGILNDATPMYSQIVLSRKDDDPNEDGLLEAWEMKDLDLNADMVVLSACETARGRVNVGEGMMGMTWALFIAGTPTTVASQWKVESSSTTELMLEFHRQLLSPKRVTKAEALRRASLKLLKTDKFRHPSYWAGFVMVGDGS